MRIEVEGEADARWIAGVPEVPGAVAYGRSRREAVDRAKALALRVLADRLEHGEEVPDLKSTFVIAAWRPGRRPGPSRCSWPYCRRRGLQ